MSTRRDPESKALKHERVRRFDGQGKSCGCTSAGTRNSRAVTAADAKSKLERKMGSSSCFCGMRS
eukprot:2246989-Rhodomonas_salina.2